MLKRLSNKQKVILFGVGVMVLVVVGWQVSFSKTFVLIRENRQMEQLNSKDEGVIMRDIRLKMAQKKSIDSLMLYINSGESKSEIMSDLFIIGERNNLQVASATESLKNSTDLFEIRFAGIYVNMVKFIRAIEGSFPSGELVSVDIQKESDRRTRRETLYMSLVFRHVKSEL